MPTPDAVVLLNLGSPAAPTVPAVRVFLREFLDDPRVIALPFPLRKLLLEGVILPFRAKKSAARYAKIWTREGSPLVAETLKWLSEESDCAVSLTTLPTALPIAVQKSPTAIVSEENSATIGKPSTVPLCSLSEKSSAA